MRRWAGLLAVVGAVYVALPYVTLYRLGMAIRDGDAQALETLVDWDEVREGIKEDICDAMAEQSEPAVSTASAGPQGEAGGALPAFGSSFMRGIAVNMIDQAVSAPALVDATRVRHEPPGLVVTRPEPEQDPQPSITWAFFESPGRFAVDLQPPGAHAQPVRLELALRHGAWQVVRAWLPADMLAPQADRT